MKYSIIIVTYNASKKIEKTLKSVHTQLFQDFEIIVIDGASDDDTLKIVQIYENKYHKLRYVSERDNGIYNAMNKGICMALGEYSIFLGAGDCLYASTTLMDISIFLNTPIICGTVVLNTSFSKYKVCATKANLKYLIKRNPICHQQIVAKTELLKGYKFDEQYKIAADQDWIMWQIKKKTKVKYINIPICFYDVSGVSNSGKTKELGIKEFASIQKKIFPALYYIRTFMLFIKKLIERRNYEKN